MIGLSKGSSRVNLVALLRLNFILQRMIDGTRLPFFLSIQGLGSMLSPPTPIYFPLLLPSEFRLFVKDSIGWFYLSFGYTPMIGI